MPTEIREYKYFDRIKEQLPRSGRILDLGCRHGALLKILTDLGYDAVGLEIVPTFVSVAKELSGCPVYCGSGENMDMFTNEEFDVVIATQVLEHVESPVRVLKEINRILKPSGNAIISTPNAHHLVRVVYPLHMSGAEITNKHFNCFDLTQWQTLFTLCGFRIIWYAGQPDNWIFPRWKGIGILLDKIFRNQERFKHRLFYNAVKIGSENHG